MAESAIGMKKLRKMAGLTQFQLAQRCGISRMRLSLAECEQVELTSEELAAIRNCLFVAIENRAVQIRQMLSSAGSEPAAMTA